jgi:hypothetical protein
MTGSATDERRRPRDLPTEARVRQAAGAIETVVVPRSRDLGGFTVRRLLPSAERQMVGPFIFFDEMGPATFAPGAGIDVRPHPHIGLATVTYLFAGEILHRDSLGSIEPIRPGEVNWMTAGRGIVHSERTPPDIRERAAALSGIQSWVALPAAHEEDAPAFAHHGADGLPLIEDRGIRVRLIAGSLFGVTAAVRTLSPLFYADAELKAGTSLPFDAGDQDRAVYPVTGEIAIGGERFPAGRLLVLGRGEPVTLNAVSDARVMLLGGAPLDGPRFVWWNFVSSRRERIEQAKADWREGRFPAVPGESEFIPLPEP